MPVYFIAIHAKAGTANANTFLYYQTNQFLGKGKNMKFKTILFMTLLLSTLSKAQDISIFDVSKEVYMFVKEQKGVFTDSKGQEVDENTKLSLCRISFYNEDDGALQLLVNIEDASRKILIKRFGLYLIPGTPFPLRPGTIHYDVSEMHFKPGLSLNQAIFDGEKIELYRGELNDKSADSHSISTIITDEHLNIQKYIFKFFQRNEHGEIEEINSYTCEATPLS